jgi:hypothetical protein
MSLQESDLDQFTGSETFYHHTLRRKVTYTEGVRFLAKEAGAYWLIDFIALQPQKLAEEAFQVWKLRRDEKGSGATIVVEDGNGNVIHTQTIPYTDFPLMAVDVWMVDNVILLPSEY